MAYGIFLEEERNDLMYIDTLPYEIRGMTMEVMGYWEAHVSK